MQIAAISDIHGDYPSLHAVWRDMESRGLTAGTVLNAGDTVAYGRETMPCIDFVRDPSRRIVSVVGNYDINAARFPERAEKFRRKWARLRPEKLQALQEASAQLTADARAWLMSLKVRMLIEIAGAKISLSHYAPTTDKEGLFDDTSEARLREIARGLDGAVDIVITGHTHTAFARKAAGVLFVNPGSVGRSFGSPTYAQVVIEPNLMLEANIVTCRASHL